MFLITQELNHLEHNTHRLALYVCLLYLYIWNYEYAHRLNIITFLDTYSEWPHRFVADWFRPDTFASRAELALPGICWPNDSANVGDPIGTTTAAVAAAAADGGVAVAVAVDAVVVDWASSIAHQCQCVAPSWQSLELDQSSSCAMDPEPMRYGWHSDELSVY